MKEKERKKKISPILIHLRLPPLPKFLIRGGLTLSLSNLQLNPFPSAQNLTLQVKTASLLRIVQVKQLLEPLHGLFQVGLAGLGRLDVEDATGFVEG